MSKTWLYLIDATAFCYRAFYALKGLSTSYGQPTNAVFGFVNFLNKILKQNEPEYLGVCFDVSRDTFRQRKFAEYKIQRPPMPEALTGQLPIIKQILKANNIFIYEKAGFEADDLIASLAKKARQRGLDVMILSADKDIMQLVDEHVKVLNPYKDKGTVYDSNKVKEMFGIEPNQIIDFLALAGDPSDNIPQVQGIGEKTAVRLIRDFKSIDNILRNIERVKPDRLKEALSESIEKIRLNCSITKLEDNIDLEFNLDKLRIREPNYPELYKIYRELEFKSLLDKLPAVSNPQGSVVDSTGDDFRVEVNKAKDISGFKDLKELILFYQDQKLMFLSARENLFTVLEENDLGDEAKEILANPAIKKIGHNLKELKVNLARRKIRTEGLYFDTMIASYLLNPSLAAFNLPIVVWNYLKHPLNEQDVKTGFACSLIFKLKEILETELRKKELSRLFFDLEMPLVGVLSDMELDGVTLDLKLLKSLSSRIENQLIEIVKKIYKHAGGEFNINSPKQLRNILFDRLKLPVIKKTKSGPSTDEEVLSRLIKQHPIAAVLLEYRKLVKIKSTYVDTLPLMVDSKTKRIHASFNQTGTQTGRLSSSNPNLQNLPIKGEIGRLIRQAIVIPSPDSCLISFDYSQIELRILAHLSCDPNLVNAFKNNQDIHIATASLIYGLEEKDTNEEMREIAKRVNFGIIYGLSSFGLSRDLGISQEEARSFIDAYFLRFPKVGVYIQNQIEKARKDGYVTTILGRRRYIPEINSKNSGIRQFAERQAVNTPIQGSAADLIKKAMIEIHSQLKQSDLRARLILQIHDELLFEAPNKETDSVIRLVRDKMEGCFSFRVPIKVVVKKGKNWLDMEPA